MHISLYAANAAFFLLLSCFPLSSLLLTLLHYLPVTQQDLFALLEPLLPSALLPFLQESASEREARIILSLQSLYILSTITSVVCSVPHVRLIR